MAGMNLRVGTRSSALAAAQASAAGEELIGTDSGVAGFEIVSIPGTESLSGEELTGKLREALLAGDCDVVVHSASDLPNEDHPELSYVFPKRESPHDAFCGPTDYRGTPHGGRIGIDSANRASQIRHFRIDLQPIEVAGDVPSRLDLVGGDLDGIIVSRAALTHLGLDGQDLPYEVMVPVAGQGALAVEAVTGSEFDKAIRALEDPTTRLEMTAERTFIRELGLDRAAPVGVLGRSTGKTVALHARFMGEGSKVEIRRSSNNPEKLATDLAAEFVKRGVRA